MFNFNNFIKTNLVNGYENGSFTEEQINIFAMNYLSRGQITKETFDEILEEVLRINIERLEAEEEEANENTTIEPPVIEETEEVDEPEEENSDDNEV